ncbi:MAG: adenylyltransferase/cytidyltransferase family protein [Kordiimonadaceae bacterium]|nr:adenylyltransferase/cytidyltransferase family protein [Kordiimonadaceae bacterium]MBO6568422.1 adenylyltransferase/cytidyltransferase family protein [Kordiimonadaceae bacterium]MBO6963849.1 adenylyltransferase/cytidyltransferase family protein [Kordiimonadaceae bacterium]
MDDGSRNLVSQKIKSKEQLAQILGSRPRDKKVIICHGTFDVVHPGHVRHLLYAKSKADILVASLTCDQHVTKAEMRPYVPEDLRAINLAAFEMVDHVIIDENATPIETIKFLEPDYFAKGYEYVAGNIPPKTQEEMDALDTYGGEMIFTPGDVVYSSSRFIETSPPNISTEKLMLLMQAEGFSFDGLRSALADFSGMKVHIVGDTIVDTFTRCSMIGGMTKTPTMSVRYEDKEDYVGGAGIVAKHLCAAGADVTFSTVLGDDALAEFVLDDLEAAGVDVQPIIDPTRPTTNKNAFVASDYRLLKLDTLDNRSISGKIVRQLQEQIAEAPTDVVVFSDFRHGIFNKHTIGDLIAAIPESAFRVADSQVASRWGNITEFKGFDLITPNEREARFALGDQDSVVRPLATDLFSAAQCKTLILKLGERGILTYRTRPDGDPRTIISIDSFAQNVADAVGAGDALLAYASLAMAKTGNEALASVLGCIAAGLECEYDGNVTVKPQAIYARLDQLEAESRYSVQAALTPPIS